MTSELLALADRVEAAKGPDRDIDGWIYCAMNPDETTVVDHEPGRFPRKAIIGPIAVVMDRIGGKDGAEYLCAPAYTASLDAAMTLVPAPTGDGNYTWAAGDCHENEYDSWACVTEPPEQSRDFTSHAATPALALTAAALRAHASRVGDGRGGDHV